MGAVRTGWLVLLACAAVYGATQFVGCLYTVTQDQTTSRCAVEYMEHYYGYEARDPRCESSEREGWRICVASMESAGIAEIAVECEAVTVGACRCRAPTAR